MLGYRVAVAQDGHEALARVQEHHPDAAIIDLMLPEPIDGMVLLSELRAMGEPTQVVFYTAQTDLPALKHDPQVAGYLSKAADRADLYALLPPAIRRAR